MSMSNMSTRATKSPMMEMTSIPEFYQDDEAFARMRALQKKLPLENFGFYFTDFEKLTERYNQAFEASSLPITEAEQIQTIETLESLHPIVWHVIQTINQGQPSGPERTTSQWDQDPSRDSAEPLLEAPKQPKFDGLEYKTYLKRILLTVDTQQDYIIDKVGEILAPRSWGKPLSKEYSQYQRFAEENYSRVCWILTVLMGGFVLLLVVVAGVALL